MIQFKCNKPLSNFVFNFVFLITQYKYNKKQLLKGCMSMILLRTGIVLLLLRKHFYDGAKSTSC